MLRKIINIDEEKCNGCGLCAAACHEGAIEMVDGKAKLVRENFCDGLGDCLPACPTGAITFEEREAPEYDEAAVKVHQRMQELLGGGGCPGSSVAQFAGAKEGPAEEPESAQSTANPVSRLAPVAVPDQTGPDPGAVLRWSETPDCGGLYCLCICQPA